jgi:hypothetical protein
VRNHVVSFLEPMATFGYSSLSMAHSTEELFSFISPEKTRDTSRAVFTVRILLPPGLHLVRAGKLLDPGYQNT